MATAKASSLPPANECNAKEAWQALAQDNTALLVDVRTIPEWGFVGVPDLQSMGKEPLFLSWRTYPTMEVNPEFIPSLTSQVPDKNTPLYFLCKSGSRSLDASIAATQAGYTHCVNISDGFEGALNATNQRGLVDGWKGHTLPWRQT